MPTESPPNNDGPRFPSDWFGSLLLRILGAAAALIIRWLWDQWSSR